jgi:hypothetical protein
VNQPAVQAPVRGSHSGAAAGQSAADAHATQVRFTGSQRGDAPAQSASVRQPTHIPAAARQNGVADPQAASCSHALQTPLSQASGATQVLGVVSSRQVVTQWPAPQVSPVAQSVAARHTTQR